MINGFSVLLLRTDDTAPFGLFEATGAAGLDKVFDISVCQGSVGVTPLDSKGQGIADVLAGVICNPLGYELAVKQHSSGIKQPLSQLERFFATVPVPLGDNKVYYGPKFDRAVYDAAPSLPVFG